ncbi:hypothetical protein D9M68_766170 [compost metagenome]
MSVLLLAVVLQRVREAPFGEVVGTGDRIEAHRIEVGQHDLVPLLLQHLHRPVEQGAVEGLRFRMGVDDQYVHLQAATVAGDVDEAGSRSLRGKDSSPSTEGSAIAPAATSRLASMKSAGRFTASAAITAPSLR